MTKRKAESSPYVNQQRRDYSLYVMTSRAIPSVTDGLKAGGRRVLWVGRDGNKWKSANLAGATTPIHPHDSPEGAINTLTAPYGNNIPLFAGDGAFGTLLDPKSYGASRYTSVKVSKFTQDVMFRDIEIIPMTENYDGTLMEPVHFLPLIPICLLNPAEGTAIGFATNILPRGLDDIIIAQITHLKGAKKITNPTPKFSPLQNVSHFSEEAGKGIAYYFNGSFEQHDQSSLTITKIPYGQTHDKVIAKLVDLVEKDVVIDFVDNSKDAIEIDIKFKRGYLKGLEEGNILALLGLTVRSIENLNVLDFTGKKIWSADPVSLICQFSDWRVKWYIKRYERLRDLLQLDLQKYYDIRCAIKKDVGGLAKKVLSRAELKDVLNQFGIVYVDYIADLPVYRFTQEEYNKIEQKITEAEVQLAVYLDLLTSDEKRRKIYLTELQEVLTKYTKGQYNE